MTTAPAVPPAPAASDLRHLLDRERIRDLVHEVGRCLDEHRFEDLRRVYTEDAAARTPGGTVRGIEALVAQARRTHTRTQAVQHAISDVAVDLDGDRAVVRANLLATFVADGTPPARPRFQLGEVYRFTARRDATGWRLDSVVSSPVWAVGERP